MKNFSDKGITTAKERLSQLIVKLGSLRPDTDTLTRREIESLLFYTEDYLDELKSMEHKRYIQRARLERLKEEA